MYCICTVCYYVYDIQCVTDVVAHVEDCHKMLLQSPSNEHDHLYAVLTTSLINIQSYRLLGLAVIDGAQL